MASGATSSTQERYDNMVTSTGAPDLGNIVDDFFDPIKKALGALAEKGEADLKAAAGGALGEVTTVYNDITAATTKAQGNLSTVVNPIVNTGIDGLEKALSVAYPPIAPLLAASEAEVENLADAGTDALLTEAIHILSGFLSNAGLSSLVNQLETKLGAG